MESLLRKNEQNIEIIPKCDDGLKPFIGRMFDSIKEFEDSYKYYAHTVGFSVRSWTATKDKNGVLKYKYFVCSKQGYKVEKQSLACTDKGKKVCRKRLNTREGCNATACVKRTQDEKYAVIRFHEGHSHKLCTHKKKHFLGSNEKESDVQENLLSRAWTQLSRCMELAKENDEALIYLINCGLSWERNMCGKVENDDVPSTLSSYCETSNPTKIDILLPNHLQTKASGKSLKGSKVIAIENKQKKPRLCRACGDLALHDSRNCPKKAIL